MECNTRLVRWTHNGFHGRTRLMCQVPEDAAVGDVVRVSASVARRLNRLVCPSSDCRCGEQAACQDQDMEAGRVVDFWAIIVPKNGATVRGNYPQSA